MYVDHEKVRLDHEKIRVQNLLQGMQNVMNTYNSSLIAPPRGVAPISQPINYGITSSGFSELFRFSAFYRAFFCVWLF